MRGGLPQKGCRECGQHGPGECSSEGLNWLLHRDTNGVIGLGGGYALVPSFIYLLGPPVKIAVGTSLTSFISMVAISGGFKICQGVVDVAAALSLGAGKAIGAQIGAKLVPRVPTWLIRAIFGVRI